MNEQRQINTWEAKHCLLAYRCAFYICIFVSLIAPTKDDNDYYIGKWMQSGKLIEDKYTHTHLSILSVYLDGDEERDQFFFSLHTAFSLNCHHYFSSRVNLKGRYGSGMNRDEHR